ncbi:MAG: nitrogen fixation protein NifZ [Terriglobales bacterium]
MIEPRFPKYQWGQRVRALLDLHNDGSYPDFPEAALLVKNGDAGEIVQVGSHTESNTPIYLVEFTERLVVGCLEEEIMPL